MKRLAGVVATAAAVLLGSAAARAAVIACGDTLAQRNGSALVTVSLEVEGEEVIAGTQNDLQFDNNAFSITADDCVINPAIGPDTEAAKTLSTSLPPGEIPTIRNLVVALDNTNPIPSGALYTCSFHVGPNAELGEHVLANVNVRAIAQGSSERNISVAVTAETATRALRAVHAGFYLSPDTISVGVIGAGVVGKAFLDQLGSQSGRLREHFNVHLDVRGVMTSSRTLLSERGVNLGAWREELSAQALAGADFDRLVDHICAAHIPHWVIVDCTASDEVARRYGDLFARGVHVVTPNKKALSAGMNYVNAMHAARRGSGAHFLYEATVGAGLPIIQTVRDLRETGDDIASIEGILSGTLAYLFNVYDGAKPFSQIVASAREQGFTEPDPRDDLSGLDVARKLVILAREMGLKLELDDVAVKSLVPAPLQDGGVDEFMKRLPEFDGEMAARLAAARARGAVLRHVGRVNASGEASVGIRELDGAHAFANISLTDNVVRFSTARYNRNPLIVQGPGAGPDVTAAAVFADLLRLASYLGARM